MFRSLRSLTLVGALALLGAWSSGALAQVTTGSIRGIVTDEQSRPLTGARITAVHLPSGTQYVGATRADGRFTIPGMRVGGPYRVAAAILGYARQSREDIQVSLGAAVDLVFRMGPVATELSAVTVTSEGAELSSTKTGTATSVRREQLQALPSISRRLGDFTRLTPQASGSSFAGQDNRLNNITVDGASFNNSFGLGGQPGDRTGVAPISLDAIEAVQVNIAPFDVRQGGFVGAAVNTVTRSGTNDFSGSVYSFGRNQDNVGTRAGRSTFNPGLVEYSQIGFRVGGPILKDKLFFFVSYEQDNNEAPLNTNLPRNAGQSASGNITRVYRSDLDSLSSFLGRNFGYVTGPYENYKGSTPAQRLTARVDLPLSDRNKLSFRYTKLASETDMLLSPSSSLGFGRSRTNAMSYVGSNYTILENIDSYAAEWNALLSDRASNQLTVTYTRQDESRGVIDNLFPFVDILDGDFVPSGSSSQTYLSAGSEPFTPNNELRYNTLQVQNNFTFYTNQHDLTLGFAVEKYESENVFFPGSQSAYVYNSLSDFIADAAAFKAACGADPTAWAACTTAPTTSASGVGPRWFQVRYNNIDGVSKPVQPLQVTYSSAYVQDEWRVLRNLTVTSGIRVDIPTFGATGFENTTANGLTFRDEDGANVQYRTQALPKATPLISPRVGFNYDVQRDGRLVVRGGTGLFTGRPAYVWISNQIGNNGVLTGFIEERAAAGVSLNTRPFDPRPSRYKPASVNGSPALQYELALTDENFRFPQVWRTNLAVDRRFGDGWLASVDFLLGQDVNGIYYINANQPVPDGQFSGPDARSRWFTDKCATFDPDGSGPTPAFFTGIETNRINCAAANAIVLKNQNVGRTLNAAVSLERSFRNGFFAKGAVAYGTASNTVDPGSIASGSFFNNPVSNDPNNPAAATAAGFQGMRAFLVASHTRDWFGWGSTTVSAFLEQFTPGTSSYVFGGDLNGDGGTANDLIYVPKDQSEMNFAATSLTSGTFNGVSCSGVSPCAITAAQQAAAWDAYIEQDPYLRTRRGQYAERGGLILPSITRMDVSVSQDLSRLVAGRKNTLQLRLDILNFTNMINSDWGQGRFLVNNQPLVPRGFTTSGTVNGQACSTATPCNGPADATGKAIYTMRVVNGALMNTSFQRSAGLSDVWRMQLGVRYNFN